MIDLHLHLDGSIAPQDMAVLSKLSCTTLPTEKNQELVALMTFPGKGTLNDYLKKFELPLSVLQTPEAVEYAVCSLGERLALLHCAYAEIRFAPQLHTRKGASQEEIVLGALKGRARSKTPINLLLCCMRGASEKENLRSIELAARYRQAGVSGVDLAGAEAIYPTENYKEIFALAAKFGLNVTIHAGEAAGEDSIRAALDFGAKRIGHGVAAIRSGELMRELAKEKIAIEICPTSNLQTGAVSSIAEHPVKVFSEYGIPLLLCSDNMTVSNTDVNREWEILRNVFSWDERMRLAFERNAIDYRFSAES